MERSVFGKSIHTMDRPTLHSLKRKGFADDYLAKLMYCTEAQVRDRRKELGVVPVYKRIDSCAGEFSSDTAYMYSCYEGGCESRPEQNKKKIMILGGGPNRIGQGIEFDYCCVHAAMALREAGYQTIMVNCNPETVSTDFDTSDRLYFESVTLEDVLSVVEIEQPDGVIVHYGGQTPLKLARELAANGVKIIGTSPDAIDMAEDRENATEEPSEKRLSEAHAKGQFAQAPEIQVVAGLVAGYLVLLAIVPAVSSKMLLFASEVLGHLDEFQVSSEAVSGAISLGFSSIALLMFPLLLATMLAGILAGGLQSGFRMTSKVLENGMEKLDIAQGFQRIFSVASVVKMGLDFVKLLIVGILVYISLQEILSDPIFFTPVPPVRLGEFIFHSAMSLIFRLAIAMAALALIHYVYQKSKVHKGMMMTHQEVKDEAKQAQGDPLVKNAMRAMARRLMVRQMLDAIPTADVVITNPTHFAVALKYERGVDVAPMVLAKGQNIFAQRIKRLAMENGVPMVENRPVAQALYKMGEVGKSIPPDLYQAAAEILGFVYRTHRYYFHRLKERRVNAPKA